MGTDWQTASGLRAAGRAGVGPAVLNLFNGKAAGLEPGMVVMLTTSLACAGGAKGTVTMPVRVASVETEMTDRGPPQIAAHCEILGDVRTALPTAEAISAARQERRSARRRARNRR